MRVLLGQSLRSLTASTLLSAVGRSVPWSRISSLEDWPASTASRDSPWSAGWLCSHRAILARVRKFAQEVSESEDLLGVAHIGSPGASESATEFVFCRPQLPVSRNEFGAGVRHPVFAERALGDLGIVDPGKMLLTAPPAESGAFPWHGDRLTVQSGRELGFLLLPLVGLINDLSVQTRSFRAGIAEPVGTRS